MSTAEDIEQALLRLSPAELDSFRQWFVEFEALTWDRQIEADVAAGRLDAFAEDALRDLGAAKSFEAHSQSPLLK